MACLQKTDHLAEIINLIFAVFQKTKTQVNEMLLGPIEFVKILVSL